ncbi:hypothetical protein C2G38_2035131 [Gigaspora rosea]|uniref:Uncharacterized protein n=1 Tax=Gigaspora rosea TaxID=44941 RepID=A0A397VDR5_9GLOM|nr:hypothetical protein C2G38_2035131 [Gigaspora rosea]
MEMKFEITPIYNNKKSSDAVYKFWMSVNEEIINSKIKDEEEMVDETNKNKENKETKWSLINFLNYRRKQADFSYDKTVERSEYKIALELLSVHDVCAKQCLENFDVKCTILFVICD